MVRLLTVDDGDGAVVGMNECDRVWSLELEFVVIVQTTDRRMRLPRGRKRA